MEYQQLPPSPSLKDYIRCYWWLDNTTDQNLDFTILPDGCFDLLVRFNNYQFESNSLTGIWSKKAEVTIPSNTQIFGIQFRLLAADYLVQEKIASLFNSEKIVSDTFWNLSTISFVDRSIVATSINQFLSKQLLTSQKIDPRKQALFQLLYQTKGNQAISFYAQQVGWSSRQINRYFSQKIGLSLKAYCTILKCAASFKHIKKGQLAPQQNYFDQSHFIKSLKKHTGHTPKALLENKNDRFLQLSILSND